MLEAKAKDTGASVLQKKFFFGDLKKRYSKKLLPMLELRSSGVYVQAYADDLAVLITGADMLWIRGMAHDCASEQELQISGKAGVPKPWEDISPNNLTVSSPII